MMSDELMTRCCDSKACIICLQSIHEDEEGGQIAVPSVLLAKYSQAERQTLTFHWDENLKSNFLHEDCLQQTLAPKKLTRKEKTIIEEVLETYERYSPLGVLEKQATQVAEMILQSHHVICFTGAGISVSAGIPTYRGAEGIDTIASLAQPQDNSRSSKKKRCADVTEETKKKTKRAKTAIEILKEEEQEDEEDTDYTKLQPTFAHRALVELYHKDLLHYLITQNCDDLHGKAGFPRSHMSELHGNVFVEYCEACFHEYVRDYCVDLFSTDCYRETWYRKCPRCRHNHYTGRYCKDKKCKGKLRDTIVNFGDLLHDRVLGGLPRAMEEGERADLCLAVGSSLTVTPANSLPTLAKQLVIINPQASELDQKATVRAWATADAFFRLLMKALDEMKPSARNGEK